MNTKQSKGLEYTTVTGPVELRAELERLLAFRNEPHFVQFQLGALQAFIKIDMSDKPFLFWYCDLNERAVSPAVRHAIADFLWEKGGEKEKYVNAPNLEDMHEHFRSEGVKVFIPNINIPDIHQKAVHTIAERQGELASDEEKIAKLKSQTRSETMKHINEQLQQPSTHAAFQDTVPSIEKSGWSFFKKPDTSKQTPKPTPTSKSKP